MPLPLLNSNLELNPKDGLKSLSLLYKHETEAVRSNDRIEKRASRQIKSKKEGAHSIS